ncbi:MAG: hypothetical protein K9H49_17090 [Bacteroidales bacterium]|nr:hypothetical protein [Bacteroidales bacterium]MCF8391513.1 hypothetical protein [Bacteroidales bacterium]
MDLIQFIRIILRNITIIIIVPVLMAVLVYVFTMSTAKTYTSKTLIYTGIASGYSLESGENTRVDYFGSNNALDNLQNIIKSKKTLEAVGVRLFAENMISGPNAPKSISKESFEELENIVPQEVRDLVDSSSLENTIRNFNDYKNKDEENFIYKLIYLVHRHYSLDALSKIGVRRIGNSDLIEISYSNDDPAICYRTLELLNAEFITNYKNLKENQTDAVVKYFEAQLDLNTNRLNNAEDEFENFNKDNKIINYYEQTKHVASLDEKFQLQYQSELLTLNGTLASIKDLENRMGSNQKMKLYASEIIDLRKELSEVNGKISLNQIFTEDTIQATVHDYSDLQVQASELKRKLGLAVESLDDLENSGEGINRTDLVNDWLAKVIIYEETKSRIEILDDKRVEFDKLYSKFAPLGTTVKRLEREIGVVEQEYLSNLQSLSWAKLKQQNIQLSSGLKVIDNPTFPINPLPSKRKFLVILAFMAGFILILAIIILLEYFDTSIKNEERAEQLIKLKVEAMVPKILPTKEYDIEKISNAAFEFIVKKIYLESNPDRNNKILFISMIEGEGKSLLLGKIAQKLKVNGHNVTAFTPHDESSGISIPDVEYMSYQMDSSFIQSPSFFSTENQKHKGYLLAEIPSINNNPIPAGIIKDSDMIFLVCRANRVWSVADNKNLEMMRYIGREPRMIINGVNTEYMESYLGEIPKKRSLIRRLVKSWLNGQFKVNKKSI